MSAAGGERPHRVVVLHESTGKRQPFLRGIVTHDLTQRGLSFEDAYATARALRDEIADREEITAAELSELIDRRVEESFGSQYTAARIIKVPATLHVTYDGSAQPFSRGLLSQSLYAAGLDLDRAYRRVIEIQSSLREGGVERIDSEELSRFVGDFLERTEGQRFARRYQLIRGLNRLPKPLVFLVGGATGTGKSTLSVDLAPLLRIYRINSTDTIRQVMRMVFSSTMLPALHHSSFECSEEAGGTSEGELREALSSSFEEQAVRVVVGVRAVIERAIAENLNIFVEGVHLLPPLVPFADLDAAAYQLMIMLNTPDEEVHRSHFQARARAASARRAEPYLENLKAIRWQQELLLQRAEESDIPLLDTTDREQLSQRAVRLFTELLEQRVPWLAGAADKAFWDRPPILMLVIDGLADQAIASLGGRTPLEAAETPTLDRLAREGQVGLADPVAPEVVPDTASGTLAVFGQSPKAMGRGPIEAIGAGFVLKPNDIALRGNLASIDANGRILDRRAGRIREGAAELAAALDKIKVSPNGKGMVTVRARSGTEHRLAIVLRGRDLSSEIVGSDPGEAAPPGPPVTPRPIDSEDERASRTAMALDLFERQAREVLSAHPVNQQRTEAGLPPANCVLTRGPGRTHALQPFQPLGFPLRVACISGDSTVLGIARLLGAETISRPTMTANLDTQLRKKLRRARRALKGHDIVVVQVKGADIAAHDQRPDLKVEFLEQLDRELGRFLEDWPSELRLAVASDHATYSESGRHSSDPVPVLIWGSGIPPDSVESFSERTAAHGDLQRFPLQLFVERVLDPRKIS